MTAARTPLVITAIAGAWLVSSCATPPPREPRLADYAHEVAGTRFDVECRQCMFEFNGAASCPYLAGLEVIAVVSGAQQAAPDADCGPPTAPNVYTPCDVRSRVSFAQMHLLRGDGVAKSGDVFEAHHIDDAGGVGKAKLIVLDRGREYLIFASAEASAAVPWKIRAACPVAPGR